jgi:glyoxalase-like protein
VLRIDHVVRAVRDLDAAGAAWEERGIATVAGGVHPGWGTANRIAALGGSYLELLAVVDHDVAFETPLGRALRDRAKDGDAWFALCLADDAIDVTAARLGLTVEAGSRTRPDGEIVSWRSAGIEDRARTPDLPFFIAWDGPDDRHPGAARPAHPSGADGILSVDVAGDAAAFAAWTGGAQLPVRHVVADRPGIVRVELATPTGELVL